MTVPLIFSRYRDRLDEELHRATRGPDLLLYTMIHYQLGWVDAHGEQEQADRGKAIRPTLCLLMCEALGSEVSEALPAAAGLELLHNFSLIHDDVMDSDQTRRHRPTVWSLWGRAQAIDAGDLLHVLAMLSVLQSGKPGSEPLLARDASQVVAHGCKLVTEGQHLDIAFESQLDVDINDYISMIERKSAALISVAFELGAIFAGNASEVRNACRKYGHALGIAFQIRDDMLGIWGDQDITGKPVGADIRKRKKTLPIIHASEHATGADRASLRSMFNNVEEIPDVDRVMKILDNAKSRQFTEDHMNLYLQRASDILANLPVNDWGRTNLNEVASFIVARTK